VGGGILLAVIRVGDTKKGTVSLIDGSSTVVRTLPLEEPHTLHLVRGLYTLPLFELLGY